MLSLKLLLTEELTAQEDAERRQCLDSLGGRHRQRRTNRHWLQKLDNMIRSGLGFGITVFSPKCHVEPLALGSSRTFVMHPTAITGEPERRSVIVKEDGSRCFDVPR